MAPSHVGFKIVRLPDIVGTGLAGAQMRIRWHLAGFWEADAARWARTMLENSTEEEND
jgi:hypothetical protein